MKVTTKKVAEAGLLLAIILLMQTIKNISAFISGPVINAVLVIAALELGIWWGVAFSVITPLTSILIAPMSPMTMITQATYGVNLPVIMIGNIILVLFHTFYNIFRTVVLVGIGLFWGNVIIFSSPKYILPSREASFSNCLPVTG